MKVAHLILTYTNACQTERLIRKLAHEDFHFYIQLDKKVGIATHERLNNLPNLRFIKNRVDVRWGGYSMLKSVFNALAEILDSNTQYDFINLLSGQDYPIKSTLHIHDFLQQNIGKNFMSVKDFKSEWPEALLRIERYHMTDYKFKGRYSVEKLLNFFLPERKYATAMECYGWSMFWTITSQAAAHVLDVVGNDKEYRRFLRHTWSPSEFVFQTVLMNSPFRDSIIKEDLMEVEFPEGSAHPRVFSTEDFGRLKASGKMFARKFNMETDKVILDKIDDLTAKPAGHAG